MYCRIHSTHQFDSNRCDLEDERDDIGVDNRRACTATKTDKQDYNFPPLTCQKMHSVDTALLMTNVGVARI